MTFFKPLLQDNRKALILWLVAAVCLLLKMYEGDYTFFVKHFSGNIESAEWQKWMKWLWHHGASLVLFALVPIVVVRLAFKEKLSEYGLTLGDWRFGLKATLAAFIILPLPLYFSAQNPEHAGWYLEQFPYALMQQGPLWVGLWALTYLPHYVGWEFFFRGFLQFGIKKHYGVAAAILVPAILTVLMHIGKPEGESWGALVGGIYLGLLALRTRSIVYPLLFHWYSGMLNTIFVGII